MLDDGTEGYVDHDFVPGDCFLDAQQNAFVESMDSERRLGQLKAVGRVVLEIIGKAVAD